MASCWTMYKDGGNTEVSTTCMQPCECLDSIEPSRRVHYRSQYSYICCVG